MTQIKKNDKFVACWGYDQTQYSKYNGEQYIKIDDVITAHFDPDFNRNQAKYHEQNEYTAYNGR